MIIKNTRAVKFYESKYFKHDDVSLSGYQYFVDTCGCVSMKYVN